MKTSIKTQSIRNSNRVYKATMDLEGTEKQIDFALSILLKKIDKTNMIAANLMDSGKMTKEEYEEGMEKMIKSFEKLTSAKYIIEHVK